MKRTLLTLIIVLVLVLTSTLTFVGCIHPADNSFGGYLSTTSYDDKMSAVRAFLKEELDGVSVKTELVQAEMKGELSSKEIEKLNLGDDIKASDVNSAVHYCVTYTDSSNSTQEKTYNIIIVNIGSKYHYYTPIIPEGELITNSYISNICDPSKYLNVTETMVLKTSSSDQPIGRQKTESTVTTTIKVDGDKAYMKIETKVKKEKNVEEFYLVSRDNGFFMYTYNKDTKMWEGQKLLDYDDFDDFVTNEIITFDHSYFERTRSGFKINSDKIKQYLKQILGQDVGGSVTIDKFSGDYYVKNARLDRFAVEFGLHTRDISYKRVSVSIETKFTKYGKTVVKLPENMD